MPNTRLEEQLRTRARERILAGQLTCGDPIHVWGGYGSDLTCSLCDQIIGRTDVEYEVEHQIGQAVHHYRFHFLCHAAWQLECAREASSKSITP